MSERSLAELAGHDPERAAQLAGLLDVYRQHGLDRLRSMAEESLLGFARMPTAREFELVALIVEAVLTLAERTATPRGAARRAWEDFDRAEAQTEAERERNR